MSNHGACSTSTTRALSTRIHFFQSLDSTQRAAVFFRHRGFTPGMQQSGASAGRTGEVYGEVPPAVVGQGEPGLDVLQ